MNFEEQVRARVESVLNGEMKPEEIYGATSVRCAIGLVLGSLEGITTLSESDAWDYLDAPNVILVDDLRYQYRDRTTQWRKRHEAANAAIAEAEEAARANRVSGALREQKALWKALWDDFDAQENERGMRDGTIPKPDVATTRPAIVAACIHDEHEFVGSDAWDPEFMERMRHRADREGGDSDLGDIS